MPLQDYSYVVPLGFNCMPAWQLRRIAEPLGLAPERIRGPFDWLILPLPAVVRAVETDFADFLRRDTLELEADPGGDHWRVRDAHGVRAWHHIKRSNGDSSVTDDAWRGLAAWLERRLVHWRGALADPAGRVALLRLEDAAVPDDPALVDRLASVLRERSRAHVSLFPISYGATRGVDRPGILQRAVAKSWPDNLDIESVEWDHDYGLGVAWRGHDASWEELCKRL